MKRDTWSAPSPCLNQCWNIANWTIRNKLQYILIEIQIFSYMKMYLKMSSAKWRPFCLGLNVLKDVIWAAWFLKSLATRLCVHKISKISETIKIFCKFLVSCWSVEWKSCSRAISWCPGNPTYHQFHYYSIDKHSHSLLFYVNVITHNALANMMAFPSASLLLLS